MLNIQVSGDAQIRQRFAAMPERMRAAVLKKVSALTKKLEAKIKREKLSGQVLNVRTGALRRSISSLVESEASDKITGMAIQSGDVKYGRIHEFGGQTAPHVIVPTKATVLAFMMSGKKVFAKRVNHPGSKMPERSFMRSSLKDMQPEITEGLLDAARRVIGKK